MARVSLLSGKKYEPDPAKPAAPAAMPSGLLASLLAEVAALAARQPAEAETLKAIYACVEETKVMVEAIVAAHNTLADRVVDLRRENGELRADLAALAAKPAAVVAPSRKAPEPAYVFDVKYDVRDERITQIVARPQ